MAVGPTEGPLGFASEVLAALFLLSIPVVRMELIPKDCLFPHSECSRQEVLPLISSVWREPFHSDGASTPREWLTGRLSSPP